MYVFVCANVFVQACMELMNDLIFTVIIENSIWTSKDSQLYMIYVLT